MKRRRIRVAGGKRIEAPVEALVDYLGELGRMDMLRFRVLLCVARKGGQCAADLARELGIDESTMCQVVRSMTEEGHYKRPHMAQRVLRRREDLADRRRQVLALTEKGAELLSWLRDELNSLTVRRAP